MQMRFFIFNLLLFGLSLGMRCQSVLQELVSLDFKKTEAVVVFKSIQNQTGAVFSFSDFNQDQQLSISVIKMPLREVIKKLEYELQIEIVVKEKYLIVKRSDNQDLVDVNIRGTVIDPNSDELLSNASIYVKKHKILVNTGDDGKFRFKAPKDNSYIKINIAKENYIDTSLIVLVSKNQNLTIKMRSFPRERISVMDSLTKKELSIGTSSENLSSDISNINRPTYNEAFWKKQKRKNVNLLNINDTIFSKLSFSLFPPISTNRLLSFNTTNNVSLNLIGGNSKGLNGAELGGGYNYVDGDVRGFQAGGVMNLVSENVKGAQVAGVFNGVLEDVKGVQIAGVSNLNDKTTNGVQISGVFQSTRILNGIQIAGILNRAKVANGIQISGLINLVDSANISLQIGGLFNKASNVNGVQVSGFINTCDTLNGLQIGIFNRANCLKNGLAIGLFNHFKNGYNKLEIAYNELGTTSLGYRSGWAPLHFHYFGGINMHDKESRFVQAGAGLASSIPLTSKLNFQADLNIRNTHDLDNFEESYFNMYNQVMIGLSWQPAKKLGIRTGITLNHFWYDSNSSINRHVSSLVANPVYSDQGGSFKHRMWIGWQVGVLLF
jgi:hypothetical protein